MKEDKEEVQSYLTTQQQARFNDLSAKDAATLTGAEKRELEDLRNDSKIVPSPTVGYIREGSNTVYVVDGVAGRITVVPFTGSLANTQSLAPADFDKRFSVKAEVKAEKSDK